MLDHLDSREVREFYAAYAVREGWSRSMLEGQIALQLHKRVGAAPNNFERTIAPDQRESVRQLVRDPYVLDFLENSAELEERELEDRLLAHIERFLLALGSGFAFMGRQYRLVAVGDEFFIDLLFYHVELRRFIVMELKVDKFTPEHAGKLAFYVNVVDKQLRKPIDEPAIGILLVAKGNKVVVEYALETLANPLAVSRWSELPDDVRDRLPSDDQLTRTLSPILVADQN